MAVLYTPHFVQFDDDDGNPLSSGLLYSYAAGTTTPKATYTTAAGDVENTNPVVLDSAGRAVVFVNGSYKFVLTDADGNIIKTTDNVTSFNASTSTNEGFYQSFSGDAATVAFTLSEGLGEDEKAIEIFSELEYSTNGTFASDTGWTKGTGWTIGSGVATATGAISTALEQSAGITIVQGKAYLVQCTVTRSAGTVTPNLGGTAGSGRSADGTYSEIIIAGATQVISFTTSGFTGTIDNVSVRDVGGLTVRDVGDYTVSGTTITFSKAPATGTNNIQVRAPYTLIGAAGAAQTAADAAIAAQAAAEGATNAVAYQFTFDSSTSMADPGTGDFRLNNATLASVTAIAADATSSVSGNPDVSGAIAAWGASTNTVKGQIKISKQGTPATFALYNVTAAVTDNTGWLEITVSHVDSNGTFSAADVCYLQFTRSGDVGATGEQGPTGTISGASSAPIASNDTILFLDVSDGDALSYDTALDAVAATLLDEDDMATDSNTRAPTQQSVKAYVAAEIAQIPASSGSILEVQEFSSSDTWTKPSDFSYAVVEMWTASAGGGAANTNAGTNSGASSFGSHVTVTAATGGQASSGNYKTRANSSVATGADQSCPIVPGGPGGIEYQGNGNNTIGQDGGNGVYARKKVLAASLGATETVTLGAAGTGGAAGTSAGGDGVAGYARVTCYT